MKSWAKFERFALDGPESDWVRMLVWPQFLAQMIFLILNAAWWMVEE